MNFELVFVNGMANVNESEKLVIAKPVASRPTSSKFKTFSGLLDGAIDGSPSRAHKRSKPQVSVNTALHNTVSQDYPQAESSETAPSSSSDKVDSIEKQSITVFRPLAKLVSKGDSGDKAAIQLNNRDNDQNTSNQVTNIHPQVEPSQPSEPPRMYPPSSANVDRISSDGYNWRKYGQKQVKGSEYPRSYFKCTHPNCPVKKKVERSLDGDVEEIVYKGEHNHPKPPVSKRSTMSEIQGHDYDNSKPFELNDGVIERNGRPEIGFSDGLNDDPRSKRRRRGNQKNEAETSGEGDDETRVWVQNNTEAEITGDGFRWRKYGQKVVKGYPYPRSYYRCTNLKCNVRKHVERALDDPSAFITTYEGKHNHEKP